MLDDLCHPYHILSTTILSDLVTGTPSTMIISINVILLKSG